MTPNFPYKPLNSRTIKGFDLLADYLWPQSAPVALPNVLASDLSEPVSSTSDAAPTAAESASTENDTVLTTEPAVPSPAPEPAPAPLEKPVAPTEFMIFMGDFIYADVPVYYGDDKEAYRRFYRRNYNSPSFRKVYERLRTFHALVLTNSRGTD